MSTYIYTIDLYHHGIKGQRWGIRRFQKKDGSLTSEGKKRYGEDGKSERKTHREKLIAKYKEQGMNQQNAELAASRRIKTEKILATTAVVTVAAASAYVIRRQIKERADHIIKSGTTLQRITSNENEDLNRAFYTAYKDKDNTKYQGLYGRQLKKDTGINPFKMSIKADDDIKVASRQKAAETFADLYKNDPEFRESFRNSNQRFLGFGHKPIRIATHEMTDRQLKRYGYDAFNIGLVNHDKNGNSIAKKFYDKLKEQGYDAVMDVNDQKYSGYGAKSPVIVFNKANKLSIADVARLTDSQIKQAENKAMTRVIGEALTKEGAKTAAALTAGGIGGTAVNTLAINNYRREHPNTRLSDKEILKVVKE